MSEKKASLNITDVMERKRNGEQFERKRKGGTRIMSILSKSQKQKHRSTERVSNLKCQPDGLRSHPPPQSRNASKMGKLINIIAQMTDIFAERRVTESIESMKVSKQGEQG